MHTGASTAARCPFSGQSRPTAGAVSREAAAEEATARPQGRLARRTLLADPLGGLVGTRLVGGVAGLGGTVRAFAAKKRARTDTHGEPLRGLDIVAKKGRD